MSEQGDDLESELQRLRDENAVLRSLLMTSFKCPNCSPSGNVNNEICEIRAEIAEMKLKQQEDADRNRKTIEKVRAFIASYNEERRTKNVTGNVNRENLVENNKKDQNITAVPPKPQSFEEKLVGEWQLISSEDCLRYIKFRSLTRDDFFANRIFTLSGNVLSIPPEAEVLADHKLHAYTHIEDDHLKTVIRREGDNKDEVIIDRYLDENNKMITTAEFNLFFNLTNSRQIISCTRVYERVN